jgi:hypothetical protein
VAGVGHERRELECLVVRANLCRKPDQRVFWTFDFVATKLIMEDSKVCSIVAAAKMNLVNYARVIHT